MIELQPGETRTVEFELPVKQLVVWDEGWRVERTDYRLWVGTSSRAEDLLEAKFTVY